MPTLLAMFNDNTFFAKKSLRKFRLFNIENFLDIDFFMIILIKNALITAFSNSKKNLEKSRSTSSTCLQFMLNIFRMKKSNLLEVRVCVDAKCTGNSSMFFL